MSKRNSKRGREWPTSAAERASTLLMAKAFPKSRFFGFDYHDKSIEAARESATRNGIADRVTFEVAKAKEFPGQRLRLRRRVRLLA